MLAVQRAMDALQRSASISSDQRSVIREPSAEDLDAAHQLVSSARGERAMRPASQETQRSEVSEQTSAAPPHVSNRSGDQRIPSEVSKGSGGVFFNQVCR